MAGLTTTGITIKSVDDVLSDIESAELANIDPDLNVGPDDVLGQLNGIVAAAIAEMWELLEEIYQSAYPDTASGQSLSYVAALTGAIRQPATKAEFETFLVGTVGTTVPAGTRFYPEGDPDSLFETTAPAVIAEHGATDYVQVTALAVTPGSSTRATDSDTFVIATPVAGLTDVYAAIVGSLTEGSDEETDTELRIRREQSLARAGSSTVEAIRSDMLTVTGVDTCTVFENPTSVTDANEVPPYAIEVLVYSAAAPSYTAQDVADQIWLSKPAGTETYGTEGPVTVTDSQGNTHNIYYSEPTTKRTYVKLTLTEKSDGSYIGDAAVKDAIQAWAETSLSVGQSVYGSDIINLVADLPGVENVYTNVIYVDDVSPPVSSSLTITARELATIAAGDVTVTSV